MINFVLVMLALRCLVTATNSYLPVGTWRVGPIVCFQALFYGLHGIVT